LKFTPNDVDRYHSPLVKPVDSIIRNRSSSMPFPLSHWKLNNCCPLHWWLIHELKRFKMLKHNSHRTMYNNVLYFLAPNVVVPSYGVHPRTSAFIQSHPLSKAKMWPIRFTCTPRVYPLTEWTIPALPSQPKLVLIGRLS